MVFDKKYDPKIREKEIRKYWEEKKIFKFNEDTNKELYSIDTPPPTISGKMHIGHAFSYTQTDFIARYKRMKGFEVFYPFGTDDNGLATEKLVQKEKKINLRNVSREEAVKIANEYINLVREDFINDFKNIGLSCDFEKTYSTINLYSQKISQETFLQLYEMGFIEQKEGPVLWDRVFQTPIAQAELEDNKRMAYLNYVKAKIEGCENTYLIYATTRPELCFAVLGISIEENGDYVKLKVGDEYWISGAKTYEEKFKNFEYEVVENLKGKFLVGEYALIPIVNRVVEISHDIGVKADFGTGIAYFCSYGGIEDIEWVSRHKKEPISVLDKFGKLNEKCLKYSGEFAADARKKIIEDLENLNHLIFKEEREQIVNIGERSGVEVEILVLKQWYVKYLDKKEYFWEMCQKFKWNPEFMKHRLENWIEGLKWNWGFSRQRHFGIPIPVWHCLDCKKHILAKYEDLPVNPLSDKCFVNKCSCGSVNIVPEEDVFDTWFTSASSPFLAINLVKNEKTRKKLFPMSLRPQAHDIINFWLFYTMAKTNLLYRKNPFENVAVSGWMLDKDGRKMSKSKGNTIIPQEITAKYSNDSLRFLAAASKLGQDMPFQEKEILTGIKIVNKLYNANKFANMLLENFTIEDKKIDYEKLNSVDKWILSKFQNMITIVSEAFENYDYAKAKSEIEIFFMRDIADNYIEIVKQRLWKPDEFGEIETKKAQSVLYYVLYNSLKCFAPILPFITEDIYLNFYKNFEKEESIHISVWPKKEESFYDEKIIQNGDYLINIISAIRKFKSEKQLSMKEEIKLLKIDCSSDLKLFIENSLMDIKSVCNAQKISFENAEMETEDKNIKIDINML